MTQFNRSAYKKLGKNTTRALKQAKDVDEFIDIITQPDTHRYRTGTTKAVHKQLKNGKPYMSEYYGMFNPTVLNISSDTLNKLKKNK